jgi:hypothetical protein
MHCTCLDYLPVIPGRRGWKIRPRVECPLHKTLAERWDEIKTWEEFYTALLADNPGLEPFEQWLEASA